MLRITATLLLFLSLCTAVPAQSRDKVWLAGEWEGTGYQIDTDTTWIMRLQVRGGIFLIEYPSLDCGGMWKLVRFNSGRASFREKITRGAGRCADNGRVSLEKLNGRQIAFRYSYPKTGEVSASAILNRKK